MVSIRRKVGQFSQGRVINRISTTIASASEPETDNGLNPGAATWFKVSKVSKKLASVVEEVDEAFRELSTLSNSSEAASDAFIHEHCIKPLTDTIERIKAMHEKFKAAPSCSHPDEENMKTPTPPPCYDFNSAHEVPLVVLDDEDDNVDKNSYSSDDDADDHVPEEHDVEEEDEDEDDADDHVPEEHDVEEEHDDDEDVEEEEEDDVEEKNTKGVQEEHDDDEDVEEEANVEDDNVEKSAIIVSQSIVADPLKIVIPVPLYIIDSDDDFDDATDDGAANVEEDVADATDAPDQEEAGDEDGAAGDHEAGDEDGAATDQEEAGDEDDVSNSPTPQRPRRILKLSAHLRSPYISEIDVQFPYLKYRAKNYAYLVFAKDQDLWEILYSSPITTLVRSKLQTMQDGVTLNPEIIDAWANVMNLDVANITNPGTPRRRVFFSTVHSVST